MMKRVMMFLGAVTVLVCLPTGAVADWDDDFDSYVAGTEIVGQGGWEEWGPGCGALVTDVQSYSAPNSVDVVGATDLVHQYDGYTEGQWEYTAWQYIPDDFSGLTYFILLNTYTSPAGPYNWSTQLGFDSSAGVVFSDFEGAELPLIVGEWAELRIEIDLDADTQTIYYGGDLLSTKGWTDGVSGGGALNIGAVDLFANGATSVYYDDMSLVPEPATCLLLALGLGIVLRRRH